MRPVHGIALSLAVPALLLTSCSASPSSSPSVSDSEKPEPTDAASSIELDDALLSVSDMPGEGWTEEGTEALNLADGRLTDPGDLAICVGDLAGVITEPAPGSSRIFTTSAGDSTTVVTSSVFRTDQGRDLVQVFDARIDECEPTEVPESGREPTTVTLERLEPTADDTVATITHMQDANEKSLVPERRDYARITALGGYLVVTGYTLMPHVAEISDAQLEEHSALHELAVSRADETIAAAG